jgi:hypothetical protein
LSRWNSTHLCEKRQVPKKGEAFSQPQARQATDSAQTHTRWEGAASRERWISVVTIEFDQWWLIHMCMTVLSYNTMHTMQSMQGMQARMHPKKWAKTSLLPPTAQRPTIYGKASKLSVLP